eukprot:Plantae.Rhodophyta-Hildenbrandia_rubra.ctg19277.p1 GENE.Plantae.Rhodophyta-Hildenbrandia_rubra.ctg19277~~Plantae.Rhodophyta-Hildenbrandia_rubra.ctg19277.p1  ORF type:complete len:486 (+),score=103.47 Plantae.Rhodophyta-Hildenbrandia_rubra.ctg19277:93-1460(+)
MIPQESSGSGTPPPPLTPSESTNDKLSSLDEGAGDLVYRGLCGGDVSRLGTPFPSAFSPEDKSKHVKLSNSNLRVSYCGPRESDKAAAAARANYHIPREGISAYYFEVTVVDAGMNGYIGVGMTGAGVNLDRLPGWEPNSYGYHGDDGNVFESRGERGKRYGPKFTTGDTVGMCWDFVRENVFFTKNGVPLGTAFEGVKRTFLMFPAIGLQSKGECVEVNFGSQPFKFDVEGYVLSRREKVLTKIEETVVPRYYDVVSEIILDYLVHNGYAGTAKIFADETDRRDRLKEEMNLITQRQEVLSKVLAGDIDGALEQVEEYYPDLLVDPSEIAFLLKTQKFLEMIRAKRDLTETLKYGQQSLGVYRTEMKKKYAVSLQDILSLVAYPDPSEHPQRELLEQERRETVAEELNAAILNWQSRPSRSILECVMQQTRLLLIEHRRSSNGAMSLLTFDDFV